MLSGWALSREWRVDWAETQEGRGMQPISYARTPFPPEIIRRAVWVYLRFTLNCRDVEELLAERGLDVPYETIRRWVRTGAFCSS